MAHGAAAEHRLHGLTLKTLNPNPNPDPNPNPNQVLPWNTYSKEDFELARAEKILAQDHYGLDDIKARFVELPPQP